MPLWSGFCSLSLVLALLTVSAESNADAVPGDYRFAIDAQPIGTALREFSMVTGYQFMFVDARIERLQAQELKGIWASDDALRKLTQGTEIKFDQVNENTIRLYMDNDQSGVTPAGHDKTWLLAQAGPASVPGGSARVLPAVTVGVDAGQDGQARALEEIIVTAQKRQESLQDVPIAIAAFDGEQLRKSGVKNLEDLSAAVPNFYVAESFVGDAVFIRGVGSGQNNLGTEQAVGQVIDGVFYGRSRFTRLSFLDVERVEVLKGPQGTLIGKNTIAGAVNTTTRRPTREFEAWLSPSYEVLADEGYSIEGAVSGPLSEQLSARIALRFDDRDGYLDNTETGAKQVARQDFIGRASVLWEPTEGVDLTVIYQHADIDHEGENSQFSTCDFTTQQIPTPPFNLTRALTNGTTEDCKANFKRAGAVPIRGVGDFSGKDTQIDTASLIINWSLGEHTLTSVTGWAQYDYHEILDSDRTRVESLSVDFSEDFEQWSQELRLASPLGDRLEYIAGVYFQDTRQSTGHNIDVVGFQARRNSLTNEDGTAAAMFGQARWTLSDTWAVSLGARYSYENKEARSRGFPSTIYSSDTPITVPPFAPAGLPRIHDVSQELTDRDFSPKLVLEWRPDEDSLYFASVQTGFKAGAFNHALVANQPDAETFFQVDPEDVIAYEVGTKLTLLNGSMQLNASLFRSEYEDLQQSVLRPSDIVNDVINVGESFSQGVEIDLRWRPTGSLTLVAAVAYLDSEFDEFADAPCYALQPAPDCINGAQDLSGRPLQFAPDWRASANGKYVWNLPGGFELAGFLQAIYSDDFFLQQDLDPLLVQDEYVKFDASLTLLSPGDRWEVALIGRNLGDKVTANYGDDVPIQIGSVWKSVDPPRSLTVQATWWF